MKRKTTVAIVAGGVLDRQFLRDIRAASVVIGADRGALWLIRNGVRPDIAIGDFDSVTPEEKARISRHAVRTKVFPAQKDKTDLELAAEESVGFRPSRVTVYGALGARFDHSWGATQVILRLASYNIYGEIVDNFNKIHIVRRQERIPREQTYRYMSVFPVGLTVTVSLTGFAYDVRKKRFRSGSSLGVSNEIRAPYGTISVHRGVALIVQSRDRIVR